jgi:hypothetical protein
MTAVVGNAAGWHLVFFTTSEDLPILSVNERDYYASIDATLPGELDGGRYQFVLEGITNPHYQQLHDAWVARRRIYVDLYLYWRDLDPIAAMLASAGLTGLSEATGLAGGAARPAESARVARLVVTQLSRRVGARRYEAVIEACERVYHALRKRPPATPDATPDPRRAAIAIASSLLRSVDPKRGSVVDTGAPQPPADAARWPPSQPRAWRSGIEALNTFAGNMICLARKSGRGMYLIRDGLLHVGVRSIPLTGGVVELSEASGLVHVETTGFSQNELFETALVAAPLRVHYALTLKGRPDLRPGDKVAFSDPFHDETIAALAASVDATSAPASLADALLGGASAASSTRVELYVSSVNHRLSRTEGFVTMVTGVSLIGGQDWEPVSLPDGPPDSDPEATPHASAATMIKQLATSAAGEPLVVGEVRAANPSGAGEPPGQTVDVWVGTVVDDGGPSRARRLSIDRDARSRASGVAYLTPFAWGQCGLVLPRYPGTRVVLGHVGGRVDDPVELGAVWESGAGPASQPGDWWLILPAAIEPGKRQVAEDGDRPAAPTGKATNDLIDADGARVIEVGKLTVRVQPSKLAAPGTRPAPPADAAEQVTIEHENGSRIVIKDSGDIVIHSEASIALSAKHEMTLEADKITVKVKDAMDVTPR